jgi:DNA polymerase-3 subunit delta
MPGSTADRLFDRLGKGKAPPVVLLLGTDPYWRDLCRRKIEEAFVPESAREWALGRMSAKEADIAEVVGRAQMRPMLAPQQVLFVGEIEAWAKGDDEEKARKKGGEDKAKKALGALTAYFEDPAPFTVLVLEAEKLDQRTRLARLLGEHALVVDLDAAGANPTALAAEMARERGVELDAAAARALVEATAGRAARMAIELDKLACYAGESRRVSAADVRSLVVAEGTAEVWELAGLLASGERGRAMALVDDLLGRGESAPGLVGALAWMFRKLVAASELSAGTNPYQAARQLGMRPEAAKTAIEHAHRLPRKQLRDSLVALAEADNRLKSAVKDNRAVMEFLVARLSRPPARQQSGRQRLP